MNRYIKQGSLFAWINKLSPEDSAWAQSYMRGKGLNFPYHAFEPEGFAFSFPDDANHREINLKLKNALRQRKARRKRVGKKAYNLVLSDSAKRKLDQLADDMHKTVTYVLNVIINEEHRNHQALKTIKKEEARLKSLGKSLQDASDITKVLKATESALHVQTMRLVITQLRLDNPSIRHIPSIALKTEALDKFRLAWREINSTMDIWSLGLNRKGPDLEAIWLKVITEEADNSYET